MRGLNEQKYARPLQVGKVTGKKKSLQTALLQWAWAGCNLLWALPLPATLGSAAEQKQPSSKRKAVCHQLTPGQGGAASPAGDSVHIQLPWASHPKKSLKEQSSCRSVAVVQLQLAPQLCWWVWGASLISITAATDGPMCVQGNAGWVCACSVRQLLNPGAPSLTS